jgi:preprotein translocase subunit SecA
VSAGFAGGEMKKPINKPIVNKGAKVGRNDPCPCGSGKKYKKCCGAVGSAGDDSAN